MGGFWNLMNSLKYIFRVMHIGPMVALSGQIIYAHLFNQKDMSSTPFYQICAYLMITGGFVNIFLLQVKQKLAKKNLERKIWTGLAHLKMLITCVLFTPVISYITQDESLITRLRFGVCIAATIVSPFMRFFREFHTAAPAVASAEKNKTN